MSCRGKSTCCLTILDSGRRWLLDHDARTMFDRCELRVEGSEPWRAAGLTWRQEQIDDICVKSKEMWERQAAARASSKSDKPLKRPLHQPVVISKAGSGGSTRRRKDDRWRSGSGQDDRRR